MPVAEARVSVAVSTAVFGVRPDPSGAPRLHVALVPRMREPFLDRWALPGTFVATMLLGGLLGFAGLEIPLMETGIAGSVLAFGLLVVVAARLPMAVSVALTAFFALTHGVAHGLELPELASPFGYAIGFIVATAALHAIGFALVRFLPQAAAPLVRIAGGASAATGAWLLLS